MKRIRTYLIFLTFIVLGGCIFDSGEKWKDSPYIVIWIDDGKNMTLNYEVGDGGSVERVGKKIMAVGSNKKYIVVKQNPDGNSAITKYYFVDRNKDHKYADPDEAVVGPLTEEEFEKRKVQLKLPDFQKFFK